jgi:caspase domain-containing protein
MRYSLCLAATICIALAAGLPAPAHAEKRVALVIGNGSYAHISGLPNVANDATAMAALFKAAKFDAVEVKQNLGVADLRRTLREFARRVADADVAALFYAGHGIEVGQVNYLIPVDARLVTDFDVEDETVPLYRVLQAMEPAKRLRLVILDACRENPFTKSMKRTVAERSVGRGLGRVEPAISNTLMAFATKPNAIAEDGKGSNSPFTAALVKHLLTPGLDLRIALGHVRDEVLASTGNRQEPYVTGSLGGGIVSIAGDAPKPSTSVVSAQPMPAPVAADVASRFDGTWTITAAPIGGCSLGSSTFVLTFRGGAVTGRHSGHVTSSGAVKWQGLGRTGVPTTYTGVVNGSSGSGQFRNTKGCHGTFTAQRS